VRKMLKDGHSAVAFSTGWRPQKELAVPRFRSPVRDSTEGGRRTPGSKDAVMTGR
jgi:hypothetical protein